MCSMSLAGTRLKNATRWGNKELEEQKFVTKEVHRSLKAFGGKISLDKQTTFNAALEGTINNRTHHFSTSGGNAHMKCLAKKKTTKHACSAM